LLWSAAYLAFAALSALCALRLLAAPRPPRAEPVPRAPAARRLLWLTLAAAGSALLVATATPLAQNVAPFPFLWVARLALYLLTFVIAFDRARWYDRRIFIPTLLAAAGLAASALLARSEPAFRTQITLFCGVLFACCMVCHGELARLKPAHE